MFGLSTEEALARVGSLAQLARIDRFVDDDGASRGARRFRMVTGGGLELEIHPDRALDIGQVTIDGIPTAWIAAGGIKSPVYYDPHGAGWLRTFGGGMLTTCGLDTFGAPSTDGDVAFGQHGRISATPAEVWRTSIEDDLLVVEGLMRQSAHRGENLTLRRRIESSVGSTEFTIHDVVTNESSIDAPHMIMYHANPGWPLVERGATFDVPSGSIASRDDRSQQEIDRWREFTDPAPGNDEVVYLHGFTDDAPDLTTCRVVNERIGVFLDLEFNRQQLPWLCEWKMMSHDGYVLGIEPVNTPTMLSRADARERDVLPVLKANTSTEYHLRFRLGRT